MKTRLSLLIVIAMLAVATVSAQTMAWQLVGAPGFSDGSVFQVRLALTAAGTPYVAYTDYAHSYKATVMRYNGTAWEAVGTPGFSTGSAGLPSVMLDSADRPYVAYRDGANGNKATVMRYNGTAWEVVGSPGFSAAEVYYPSLALDAADMPYVACWYFVDNGYYDRYYRAAVMRFDGTEWETVGSPGFSSGNGLAYWPGLALDSQGVPYVAYQDRANGDKATVMRFDGTEWETVGSPGFSSGGARFPSLVLDSEDTPYVAYQDWANSRKVTVMWFNGTSWVTVGSPGVSTGEGWYPSPALDVAGLPWVAYTDFANEYKATVMRYNGTAWETVGFPGFSTGEASWTTLALDAADTPYVAYEENYEEPAGYIIRKPTVMRYVSSDNIAPVANPGGPYLGAINTAITFDGTGSSDADDDLLTYAWTFGDGGSATGAAPAHSYAAVGVYDACLTVNDGTVDSPQACTLAVVYDPSAGFVTGGGWINSQAGAYKPDPTLSGQATFGFVSKYRKGATVPTGSTQFQFSIAGFSFYSETYEWLVVNQAGTNAQFKGSGLINGAADPNGQAYKFMLWTGDGSPDTFRIRIWWEDADAETDVYDNGVEQAIGAGNIVVHTSK